MKRHIAQIASLVLLSLFMMLLSCGGGGKDAGTPPPGGTYQWTYMVYMGADNNLSDAGLGDLNEMEMVGSGANVAIVVQAEFSTKYTQGMTSSNTGRFLVTKDNDPNSVNLNGGTNLGNVNMASPAALTDFIKWAKATYPANHYALVIWDHGAGWKTSKLSTPFRGAVQDETDNGNALMSLPDLAKGVADSGVHLDIINFDACLMAMYEVAYEFKGLTDYMVFAEHTEPGEGDPYDTILAALSANPSMSARDLSSTIATKFDEFFTTNNRGGTTKSAVDMSKLATLDAKVLALANALKNDAASPAVVNAAIKDTTTQNYAYPANRDLWHFSDNLTKSAAADAVKTAAAAVKTAVSDMVVKNEINGADMANSHGIAVYMPSAGETSPQELADYALLASNKAVRAAAANSWGSYLETFLSGVSGGTASYKPGDFGVYVAWTDLSDQPCDADLDLYVWEPVPGGEDLFAPWMGQTSPNGFFSADSTVSGKSEEYYIANTQVLAGDYYFLVNYWDNGNTCNQAKASLFVYDPASYGDSNWHEAGAPVGLDLSNIWTTQPIVLITDLNNFSDWWVPYFITRAPGISQSLSGSGPLNLSKRSQMIIRYKKGTRLF